MRGIELLRGYFREWLKGFNKEIGKTARYAPYGYKYNKERKLLEIDEKERA